MCIICGNPPEFDDVQMTVAPGRVICCLCWYRVVEDNKRMSAALRRDVARTADGAT